MFSPPATTGPGRRARRAFLADGTLLLSAGLARGAALTPAAGLSFGLVTDVHYADKDPAGTRHYRESLPKLEEAAERIRAAAPAFVVELGDMVDAADTVDTELDWLRTIDRVFATACPDRHYVLGNHCVDTLTKAEFLGAVGQASSSFSFDRGGIHFVVLDACFRADGIPYGRRNSVWTDANVPPEQLEWLAADLAAADGPTIVFAHQRLDVATDHGVRGAPRVRRVLEDSRRVLAVFQGHSHANDLTTIGDIHYCTLVAMVEGSGAASSGWTLAHVTPDGTLRVEGFRRQASHDWPAPGSR